MRYVSTRGAWSDDPQPFCAILLEGLAPDGGLAVPQAYSALTERELAALRPLSYPKLAFAILSRFIDDIPPADLRALIERHLHGGDVRQRRHHAGQRARARRPPAARGERTDARVQGHRAAAARATCSSTCSAQRGRALNILGATSGDTGSSAEYAMRGKRGIAVFMLSPQGRMSPFQTAQMFSLADPDIHNVAIEGVFDDCQDIVKAVGGDAAFKARHAIGTVNSINWARIAAQIVYYFKGYFAVARAVGDPVDFAVPSGNFGNILAGHVAKRMGLPIRRLILATNENDVLDEFFRTGRYRPRGTAETHATSSPSMDISKASNFERYVYDIVLRDPAARSQAVDANRGGGRLRSRRHAALAARCGVRLRVWNEHARRPDRDHPRHLRALQAVLDPHTADGVCVGRRFRDPEVPLVCIETALPAKFATTIREALGRDPERPAAYADLESRPQRCDVLPADAARVKNYIAAHAKAAA